MEEIKIKSETINLDQFLKWAVIVGSGGEAKYLIKEGNVEVNGEIENRRGRKLSIGDKVKILPTENTYLVSKE